MDLTHGVTRHYAMETSTTTKSPAAFLTPEGRPTRQPKDWVERFEQVRKQQP